MSSLKYEFRIVQATINDFSKENRLGGGKFGPMYKVKK